jgi:hypothetical protein
MPVMSGSRDRLLTDADALRFDNPQSLVRGLGLKHDQSASQQCESVLDALRLRAQYSDALMTLRRVMADIGKIEIERNEDAILCSRGIKDSGIGVTPQTFAEHRVHIVTSLAQKGFSVTR